MDQPHTTFRGSVASDIHSVSDTQQRSSEEFLVDASLGRDTVFGIIVEDE